jgi:hypothetical protein
LPLAAEVDWSNGSPLVTRMAVDYDALKRAGRPVGIALRIAGYAGPFRPDDAVSLQLQTLARELIETARKQGITIAELQIDFDCAASKLGGYRVWVRAIHDAVKPVPVRITVLPSWMEEGDFGSLAREAGGFVLQVHSTERPRDDDGMKLCDPARAAEWVERAAKFGVPFRVALPTYTYLIAFDKGGNLAGISAEGPVATWPAGVRFRYLRADAAGLSGLVRKWTGNRPANLTGVIWYRLPVETDTMNWRWPTLAAIIDGRVLRSGLRVEVSDANPADISLLNDGDLDAPLPAEITAQWEGTSLMAGDALNGFVLETGAQKAVFRAPQDVAAQAILPAGGRRAIGWLRLESKTAIHVTISKY